METGSNVDTSTVSMSTGATTTDPIQGTGMSRYFIRKMAPECAFAMVMCKLLTQRGATVDALGYLNWVLPNTGNKVYVRPRWITESA